MKFELTDALTTGIRDLDDDHRELIEHVNAISELERLDDKTRLLRALHAFRTELEAHFKLEETHLRAVDYPSLDSHRRHHADVLAVLDRLIEDLRAERQDASNIAGICYHEVICVVLLKDMRFLNWLADRPGLKPFEC